VGSLVTLAAAAALLVPALQGERDRVAELQARAVAAHLDDELGRALGILARLPGQPHVSLGDDDPAPESGALHAVRLNLRGFDTVVLVDHARHAAADPAGTLDDVVLGSLRTESRPGTARTVSATGRIDWWLVVPYASPPPGGVAAARLDPHAATWMRMLEAVSEPGVVCHVQDQGGEVVLGPAAPESAARRLRVLTAVPWTVALHGTESDTGMGVGLLAVALSGLVLALGFAWGAARSVTQPLGALEAAAERVASGDLDREIHAPGGGAEVDALARSLEAMRAALQGAVQSARQDAAELERRVAERTAELRAVTRRTITAQEDERRRLARDLHDDTCQALAALCIGLDMALAAPPSTMRDQLALLRPRADHILEELRRLIVALRPSVLDDLGLLPAIRWFAERQLQPLGIAVRCELEDAPVRLFPEAEAALFRCVQEVLTNSGRHSDAERVLVQASFEDGVIVVEVEDDGAGFDPAEVARPATSGRGLGLLGLRERVALLGGTVMIDSTPGSGTRVRLEVPTAPNAAPNAARPEAVHGR
jgi:signal transduction histidine kinase